MTHDSTPTPPSTPAPNTTPSARSAGLVSRPLAGLVAGIGLLLMAVLAGVSNFAAIQGPVTPGDPTSTATAITDSMGTFRLGVLGLYLVAVLDVVVAWALFEVFRPVDAALSRLAAWLRLAYAAVFLVATAQLAGIPELLDSGVSGSFAPGQADGLVLARVNAFNDLWTAGLLLFGLHLLAIGYLAYRSTVVPRWLGVLLAVSGLGYAIDTLVAVLVASPPFELAMVTFLGELLLALWLVIRWRRLGTVEDRQHTPV